MRLGFDVTPLTGPAAGVTRYTLELLRALRENAQEIDLVLLADGRPHDAALARELDALPRLRTPWIPSRAAWMQTALPLALARAHLDICHYTNYAAPVMSRTPSVVTLHDMSLITNPEQHPTQRVVTLRSVMRHVARRARAVACPTESARREAINVLGIDPRRAHVLPGAVAPIFRRLPDSVATNATLTRYGIMSGYLLFVGTIEPRKNLLRLARAFATLRQEGAEAQLVICGRWGWKSNDLRPAIERLGIADAVVFTGFVPDDDLVALLNGAMAFVYPSLYEGFGLPIVEAFACGAPVVTSDRGATAEVAGGAALLVDPTSDESLTDALRRVLSDTAERHRLSAAGLARAADFSRSSAARRAVGIYEAALGT
jgi:glycosyltransferase involved in cell wall biosynthesis